MARATDEIKGRSPPPNFTFYCFYNNNKGQSPLLRYYPQRPKIKKKIFFKIVGKIWVKELVI